MQASGLRGDWYIEAGQGMGATLGIANERNAYTITDRGTYLALRNRVTLPILVEGDKALLNIYSVMEVNPPMVQGSIQRAAKPSLTSWSLRRRKT